MNKFTELNYTNKFEVYYFIFITILLKLQELSEINGNFFVSPASMKATLAMILEGANGKCAEEIRNALRLRLDQADGQNKVRMLLNDLKVKRYQLKYEIAV